MIESYRPDFRGINGGGRTGKFLLIVEVDFACAKVLKKLLQCLEVVSAVSDPQSLDEEELSEWRRRFESLDRRVE